MGLHNQIAIVTGGGQGLGRQIALRLAQEGSQVVIADINKEGSRETAEMIGRNGDGAPKVIPTDIRQENQVTALIQAALSIAGRIDILVNNSGIMGPVKPIEDITVEEWEDTLAVNLRGMFLCCKHTIPPMKKQGSGTIVNISSNSSLLGEAAANIVHYGSVKGFVNSFTKSLAWEWAKKGVRVNNICPGWIVPEDEANVGGESFWKRYGFEMMGTPDQMQQALEDGTLFNMSGLPIPRLGRPEDIAYLCLFLASDVSGYITGQMISVSGGAYMH